MNISQFIAILRARWVLVCAILATSVVVTIVISLMLPKQYTSTASVVVDPKPDPVASALYGGMMNPAFMATQVDVIQSDRVAARVVRSLKFTDNPQILEQWRAETGGQGSVEGWLVEAFQKNLDVKPSRESNVIAISYRAADPKFAAVLANAFVQAYAEIVLELKVDPARQYSSYFDTRVKAAREDLESAQSKVSAFQKAKSIIATDERFDVENQRLSDLSAQLVTVQAQATDSSSRQNVAAGGAGERMQEVLGNPVVSGLQADLARSEARLQELSARYGDAHPQVIEIKANINELRKRIDGETRKITGGVSVSNNINQQRVAELRVALEAQRAKVLQMKAVRDDGQVLVRDADNAQRNYDLMVARLNQSSLESQVTQSYVSVLTQATPSLKPSSPRILINTFLSIFAGSFLAIGAAYLAEVLDRRVRVIEDVMSLIGLPVIGVLPKPGTAGSGRRRISMIQQRVLGALVSPTKGA